MKRRTFVKYAAYSAAAAKLPLISNAHIMKENKIIKVINTNLNFEREKLRYPFGFKGGYLTELWQTVARLQSEKHSVVGVATQSVLYGDAGFFAEHSEAAGNALMFALTEKALQLVKATPFSSPPDLLKKIMPALREKASALTGRKDLNTNFLLNALVSVDNAAWLLFAAENGYNNFTDTLPGIYQPALSYQNKKVAVMFQVSYGMAISDIQNAVREGYFIIKIKTGQPGTQQQMLEKDMQRLTEIHNALKNYKTHQTANGKLIYTMDSNARYEKKETLQRYIDHAKRIGAFEQILFIEEPLVEENEEWVGDLGVRIGADESVHDEASAVRRIKQGYGLMVLKGIAKTLSNSITIAKLAHENKIPCICADLTVNPLLVNWNKNLAARVAPFPGLGMGMIETNGDMNYVNWKLMCSYQSHPQARWNEVVNGVFELEDEYFQKSGGIFETSPHYNSLV